MTQVDWGQALATVLAPKGEHGTSVSKARKRCVRAVRQQCNYSKPELEAQFEDFLRHASGPGGLFLVEHDRVLPRQAASTAGPRPDAAAQPSTPGATIQDTNPSKKRSADGAKSSAKRRAVTVKQEQVEQPTRGASTSPQSAPRSRKPAKDRVHKMVKGKESDAVGVDKPDSPNASKEVLALEEPQGEQASTWRQSFVRQDVKSGPYTKEEKDIIRAAVIRWGAAHGHSTEDLSWVTEKKATRARKDSLWKYVSACLPHRIVKSVWAAGQRMFWPVERRGGWTAEEDNRLLEYIDTHGKRWKGAGDSLGRLPDACRDRYREIWQRDNRKSGRWKPDEVERLKEAVEEFMKAHKGGDAFDPEQARLAGRCPRGSDLDRRRTLDGVDWDTIAARVGSRSTNQCCAKWYTQVSPSMVSRGEWGPGDDRRLIRALHRSGAEWEWQPEWDNLVPGRLAQQTKRRWRLMSRVVPDFKDLSFGAQVDWLVDAYLPKLKAPDAARPESFPPT